MTIRLANDVIGTAAVRTLRGANPTRPGIRRTNIRILHAVHIRRRMHMHHHHDQPP